MSFCVYNIRVVHAGPPFSCNYIYSVCGVLFQNCVMKLLFKIYLKL